MACGATKVSDAMLDISVETLANCSPAATDRKAVLLPELEKVQDVICKMALAVALQAQKEGLAPERSEEDLKELIRSRFWSPEYRQIRMAYC